MRRLIALLIATLSFLSLIAPAGASPGCRYVHVYRPDGQPPVEIWVCP